MRLWHAPVPFGDPISDRLESTGHPAPAHCFQIKAMLSHGSYHLLAYSTAGWANALCVIGYTLL
jgi:hypothetical protein